MPEDFDEFARIIARNFPEEGIEIEEEELDVLNFLPVDFLNFKGQRQPEQFTLCWLPGIGRIDILFTPDGLL